MKYVCTVLLFGVLLLTGCGASHNPREGGFFGGIGGLGSGAYQARVQEREDRLSRLQQVRKGLEAESEDLSAEKTTLREQIDRERALLGELESSMAELEQAARSLEARDQREQRQIVELRSRLADLKSGIKEQESSLSALDQLEGTVGHGTGSEGADLRRSQLEEQRRQLQEEYELLLELALELTG